MKSSGRPTSRSGCSRSAASESVAGREGVHQHQRQARVVLVAQREHLAGDDVEEALPVLGLQQRLGAGQPHARAEPAVEPQHDRLLQRLALGVGVGGQLVELGRVGHGLDRVLGHQPGLARLELAVVVLEGADRVLRDALRAHLLDARAQSVLAHGDDSSRRLNVPAPSTRAPERAHARGELGVGGDHERVRRRPRRGARSRRRRRCARAAARARR